MVELTTASATVFAVIQIEKNDFLSSSQRSMRTLVLNLRLREGFQDGGNDFPQSPFLTLDGGRGHGAVDRATDHWDLLSSPSLMSEN